jgi:hypothetical protein
MIKVPSPKESTRLQKYLIHNLPQHASRSAVKYLIRGGYVHINDARILDIGTIVHPCDKIDAHLAQGLADFQASIQRPPVKLHSDDKFICIHKPVGLSCHSTHADEFRVMKLYNFVSKGIDGILVYLSSDLYGNSEYIINLTWHAAVIGVPQDSEGLTVIKSANSNKVGSLSIVEFSSSDPSLSTTSHVLQHLSSKGHSVVGSHRLCSPLTEGGTSGHHPTFLQLRSVSVRCISSDRLLLNVSVPVLQRFNRLLDKEELFFHKKVKGDISTQGNSVSASLIDLFL